MPVRIDSARFPEKLDYSASEMTALGKEAIRVMFQRWDRAHDLGDSPAPPLQMRYAKRWDKSGKLAWMGSDRGYRAQKIKKGGVPIRNLMLTGAMRRDIQVISATTNQAVIGAATQESNRKLFFNQRRHRMFGLSLKDWGRIRTWMRNVIGFRLPKAA